MQQQKEGHTQIGHNPRQKSCTDRMQKSHEKAQKRCTHL
uniref:Uncharacterized protein n=1 Tax=Arundo donax TaxID=35708 RepID=A0A0A9AL49_ARUDO